MLYHSFLTNQGKTAYKWVHYFPAYERHLEKFKNQSIVFWEIGVLHGGSLDLWKGLLGPLAVIVGIDINPNCARNEDRQVRIRIGSQSDTVFLQSVIDEFGPPDVVLDDGSHLMNDMRVTFEYMYPRLNNNGVYIIEDMECCYQPSMGGGLKSKNSFMEYCKNLLDELNGYRVPEVCTEFTKSTYSMCFYDAIAVFEKMRRIKPYALKIPHAPAPKKTVAVPNQDENELAKELVKTKKELRAEKNKYALECTRRLRIKNSLSWKLTSPLRAIGRFFRSA
jgi:hypothetical protein